jgi:hypothetical protein
MSKFRLAEVRVTPPEGDPAVPLPGPSFSSDWLAAAGRTIAQYWLDMSGGREAVQWFLHPLVQLPLGQAEKDALTQLELIQAVKEAAAADGLPFADDEHVILLMNDPSSSFGVTPTVEPIVAAKDLDPSMLMHEMGHAFQRLAGNPGGHASTPTPFSMVEYNDPTCVMGFEPNEKGGGRWAFKDPMFDLTRLGMPTDSTHSDVGPGMCPPMTARCGWLEEGNPAAVQNVTASLPAVRVLTPWIGAPPPGYAGTFPSVLTVDGHAPGGDRVYLSVFVSCRDDNGLWPQPAVLADVHQLQEAEKFVVHELQELPADHGRNTLVAIQTSTGEFIRAIYGGGSFLVGDRREVGLHEQFRMIQPGGDGLALQSLSGHLWSAPRKGRLVTCTGLSAGDWEWFQLLRL